MRRLIGILLLFVLELQGNILYGQWVKEDDSTTIWFQEGVYLNKEDFFRNKPSLFFLNSDSLSWRTQDSLKRARIWTRVDRPEFHEGNIDINARAFLLNSDSGLVLVRLNEVWGFCILGIPYLHAPYSTNENFIKIPIQGTINFLNYTIRVEDNYMGMDMRMTGPGIQTEFMQLVVDMEDYQIVKHTRRNLEDILERDESLFSRYKNERKRSKLLYQYVKEYNETHPVTFR